MQVPSDGIKADGAKSEHSGSGGRKHASLLMCE